MTVTPQKETRRHTVKLRNLFQITDRLQVLMTEEVIPCDFVFLRLDSCTIIQSKQKNEENDSRDLDNEEWPPKPMTLHVALSRIT